MAFNLFTQIPGPKVSVSLFGDAATQGIAAGNAQKTKTQARIEGAIEGIQTGQQIVSNQQQIAVNQNRIEQLPVENQMRQEQLENAQNINELNELKVAEAQATQDLRIEIAKTEALSKLQEAEQQKNDYVARNRITEYLANKDPQVKLGAMTDPAVQDYLMRNPKAAEQVAGALSPFLDDDQKKKVYEQINFSRVREQEHELEKLNERASIKSREETAKSWGAIQDDGMLGPVVDGMTPQEASNLIAYPLGYNPYSKDPEERQIENALGDGKFEIFDTKTKKSIGLVVDKSTAEKQNKFRNNIREAYPEYFKKQKSLSEEVEFLDKDAATSVPEPTARPRNLPQVVGSLTKKGLPAETTEPFFKGVQDKVKSAGIISQTLARVIPEAVYGTRELENLGLPAGADESAPIADVRTAVTEAASSSASETMQVLREGTPEQKRSLRAWSEANGVPLNPKGLKKFYIKELQRDLIAAGTDVIRDAENQRASLTRAENAQSRIVGRSAEALRGMTPEQVLQDVPNAPNAATVSPASSGVSGVPTSVAAVASIPMLVDRAEQSISNIYGAMGASSAAKRDALKISEQVLENPLLTSQPAYVKAISAVESGGKNSARSATGVRGAMQVTQLVANQYGLDRNIPEENVMAGKLYIEDLIRQFRGNKKLAYAAYNAGPGVIRYAQRLAGGSNDWETVKKHIFPALKRYEKAIGVPAERKIKEVFAYPDKVALYEDIFS